MKLESEERRSVWSRGRAACVLALLEFKDLLTRKFTLISPKALIFNFNITLRDRFGMNVWTLICLE